MDLKYNPTKGSDIDDERERREEMLAELKDGVTSSDYSEESEEDDETFDVPSSQELEALLPYYHQVEDEALKVARKYFRGTFVANSWDVHQQKLFEYVFHGHIYRCYVDIYNENEEEINIIEVKATTNSKYILRLDKNGKRKGLSFTDVPPRARGDRNYYPLFVKEGNVWRLNEADSRVNADASNNYEKKKKVLLDRYSAWGKYPHDLAFQRFVIEHVLRKAGDNRPVNYYLAVLNCEYVYDGTRNDDGACFYNETEGQEIITFLDMNEITEAYQTTIIQELARLESYIATPHDIKVKTPIGKYCAWGANTECVFWQHCFQALRFVPDTNKSNNYVNLNHGFKRGNIENKYQLVNEGYYKFDDVPKVWLTNPNHTIQRECYESGEEYVDKEKMEYWFDQLKNNYPIYHFDFEAFPCPLPRFRGETPYRQSVFEFSLHIERAPGVCDKNTDNFIFLNEENFDDEREALAKAIVDHFEFDETGKLIGTMLAQNTSYEKQRLTELATLFPQYSSKLLAIRDKSADLIHLLRTKFEYYVERFGRDRASAINYYHKDLSGSYSIKKTLPVLVPALTYEGMEVGNGVQAYITYLSYDSPDPTFDVMKTKAERRAALKTYCQQDTWAMVEILRAVRAKVY